MKSVDGIVTRVNLERSKIFVKPENEEALAFKFRPERFKVTLDGQETQPEAIEKGQKARVQFETVTTRKKEAERNIARSIDLEARGDG